MRDDVLACYPAIDPERVQVIHNGIDTEEYKPDHGTDVLERHGVDPSTPYVIFVGRITHQKGLEHLLDAAPSLDPKAQPRALRRRARHARDRRARPLAHPAARAHDLDRGDAAEARR